MTGDKTVEKSDKGNKRIIGLIILIILLAAVAGYFFLSDDEKPPPVVTASIASAPSPIVVPPPAPAEPVPVPIEPEPIKPVELVVLPETPGQPPILHPIETEPSGEPLPELGDSDKPFRKALGEVSGKKGLALFLSEELIYHIVVTVDNLPRKYLPAAIVPLKRVEGAFIVEGKDETLAIDARNANRYAAYMTVAKAIDSTKLVALYRSFYPLFQRAYQEIGYPKANFNDRLVVAIDDLIAAPDPKTPVRLAQPRILFEYANPGLESRSAGQKIMMRIGQENARILKAKLSEIRALVTR
jgi:hypothetical protein